MKETVRFGVIGTSWWADSIHLPALVSDPRVALVAISGRSAERAQETAAKYGSPAVFTDYREMIAKADLDAILIAAPDDLHCEMTMAALDAGLHVLCEKPLALNASDAKAMYDRAEAAHVRHMVFFTWRWMPHIRYMRELIDQGVLGHLYHAQFSFMMGGGLNPEYQWRLDRTRANGVLGDLGSHMFDMARYLAGDVTRVSAHLASHVRHTGSDGKPVDPANDSALALLEFAGGAQGGVHVSVVARVADPFFEQQLVLHGEKGSIKADMTIGGGVMLQVAQGDAPMQPVTIPARYWEGVDSSQPFFDQFAMFFSSQPNGSRLFVEGILENRPVVPSFYEGWKAQQIIDAAIAANERGCWVDV